jgi:hypothetical protein
LADGNAGRRCACGSRNADERCRGCWAAPSTCRLLRGLEWMTPDELDGYYLLFANTAETAAGDTA